MATLKETRLLNIHDRGIATQKWLGREFAGWMTDERRKLGCMSASVSLGRHAIWLIRLVAHRDVSEAGDGMDVRIQGHTQRSKNVDVAGRDL